MKRVGKIGKRNIKANKELKALFIETGIRSCEIKLPSCLGSIFLTYAHRHKRVEYISYPEMLANFNQVILACVSCHETIEHNRTLTKELFLKLRGEDLLNVHS